MGRIPGKNIVAKIFAIIFAALLWLYVMNEQNPPIEASFTVPLEVQNLTGSYTVLDAPDSVRVKVRGSRSVIAGVTSQDIQAYMDVKGLSEGRQTVKVHVNIPSSVELMEVNPDKVHFRLDQGSIRQVKVEVNLTGAVSPNIAVNKIVVRPELISVEGPKSILDAVDKAVVAVDLTGKTTDFSADLPVTVVGWDGKEVQGISSSANKVNVAIQFAQNANHKVVDVKPMTTGNLAPGMVLKRIAIDPEKVQLEGNPELLQKIDVIYTEPINLSGISKDTTSEVKLQTTAGVTLEPASVKVNISVSPTPKGE